MNSDYELQGTKNIKKLPKGCTRLIKGDERINTQDEGINTGRVRWL